VIIHDEATALDKDRGPSRLPADQPGSTTAFRIISVSCAGVALAIALLGVSRFDLSIVRYVRSVTVHVPWQKLTIPWMAFTSDVGNWIGEGTHLVALSILLFIVGWKWSLSSVKRAGVETLLAHGLVTVVVIGLKHLIGRPRPKFTHSGEWQIDPTWASGFDSFPSGHSGASVAVVTVLAKRFPALVPLWVGIAAFVTLSRVLRGSHFPTDVFMGAVLGVLSGSIAAAPLKAWRVSLQTGLVHTAIGACVALAVLWSVATPPDEGISGMCLAGLGLAATASGLWLRRTRWIGAGGTSSDRSARLSFILIAYGLASMTTSLYVVAATGFACMACWLQDRLVPGEKTQGIPVWPMAREGLVLAGVALALVMLYGGRDVMPFR